MEWYKQYPQIPVEEFTWENSGARLDVPPPWKEVHDYMRGVIGIQGEWGLDKIWTPVGYTTDIPQKRYQCVAIMFENRQDWSKAWWHFRA